MNRVILINKTKAPSREELVTSERRTGELLFAQFPNLRWAGYIIAEGFNRKSANWIIDEDDVAAFHTFAKTVEADGYEVAVYANGTTRHGGQCEVRVI
jgi:hypothetical protein